MIASDFCAKEYLNLITQKYNVDYIVHGDDPRSFRAEACGMLSALRFLVRGAEFAGFSEPLHGFLVTDSQSLLDALEK